MNINRFYPKAGILTTVLRAITVVEMPVTGGWERIYPLGGNYITFILKGEIQIRSKNIIYEGLRVFFNTSGTNFFEFKVLSDIVLVVVSMKPTAFTRMFNLNPADYCEKFVSAEKAIGDNLLHVRKELCDAGNYKEIAGKIFEWIDPLCRNIRNSENITDDIVEYIHEQNGCVKIKDIVGRFGMSRRSLEKYFNRYIGIAPAHYTKTCRFASVLTLLQQSKKQHVDVIMSILEYYDYSHFQKDFKRYTGTKFQDYIREKQHPLQEFTSTHNSNFSLVK